MALAAGLVLAAGAGLAGDAAAPTTGPWGEPHLQVVPRTPAEARASQPRSQARYTRGSMYDLRQTAGVLPS